MTAPHLNIGNKVIGEGEPTFLIAEAGINHNGNKEIAHKLIDAAADSGADAVKFQTFITEEGIHQSCPRPSHESHNIKESISHFDLVKKWELPFDEFIQLKRHAEDRSVIFISTPYDLVATKYLIDLNCAAIKIASAEMVNLPMLDMVRREEIPILLSTGMNKWSEIVESADFLMEYTEKLCILKCTSNYPASPESINLRGITKLKYKFPGTVIGFSDHSAGSQIGLAALGFGINLVERHFTLDKQTWGPDHRASMEPNEFKNFVKDVRKIEKAFGNQNWDVQEEEKVQEVQQTVFQPCARGGENIR